MVRGREREDTVTASRCCRRLVHDLGRQDEKYSAGGPCGSRFAYNDGLALGHAHVSLYRETPVLVLGEPILARWEAFHREVGYKTQLL